MIKQIIFISKSPTVSIDFLLSLLHQQIWKCVADDISSNKRTPFDLLAEFEHEAGVSTEESLKKLQYRQLCQTADYSFLSLKKTEV